MATALLMMVAGLPRTRANTDEERTTLQQTRETLAAIRDRLTGLADVDADAYSAVLTAYRLPKATEAEQADRRQAVQLALRGATESPLDVLRVTAEASRAARLVAMHGNRSAASDVRVALELLEAAAAGAAANVEINLIGLDDDGYRKTAAGTVLDLTNRLTEDAAAARSALAP